MADFMNMFLKIRLQIPKKEMSPILQRLRHDTLYQIHQVKYLYIKFITYFLCFFVLPYQDHFNQGISIACIRYSRLSRLCNLGILSSSGRQQ